MFRCLFYFCVFLIQSAVAQNFEVKLSSNVVGLDETFEISFVLDDNGSNFSPPPFSENFHVLSGPNRSSSTRIINGDMTQESSYKYVLRAKKT